MTVPGVGQYQKSYDISRETATTPRRTSRSARAIDQLWLRKLFVGGLNLAANLLGKPGKMDVQGYMVQDMYDAGKVAEINDYCRCDVLDTYFVFLRSRVIVGELTLDKEQRIIFETKDWLKKQAETVAACSYLSTVGGLEEPVEGVMTNDPPRRAGSARMTNQ